MHLFGFPFCVLSRLVKLGFYDFDPIGIELQNFLFACLQLDELSLCFALLLITAESACILTAETVDLLFYNYSILLAAPLALLAGAFTVVVPEAYRKVKSDNLTKSKLKLS
jgi:hypothetical protein